MKTTRLYNTATGQLEKKDLDRGEGSRLAPGAMRATIHTSHKVHQNDARYRTKM